MSPAMGFAVGSRKEEEPSDSQYQKGVRYLCENGIKNVPNKYRLPVCDRPNMNGKEQNESKVNLKLPVIDFAQFQGLDRSQALKSLAKACENYGFFRLTNHGIPSNIIHDMFDVSRRFFELPYEERAKYMSPDMYAPVRYGTSYNQNTDGIFCWRDFLKLMCQPLSEVLPHWPSSPVDLREAAVTYSKQIKLLFVLLMEAILESLGLVATNKDENENNSILEQFKDGSQLMVVNCYPPCPEPDLTLGMPPHSDYGFLTLLLNDEIEGLQIQSEGKWFTVEPVPGSLVINVGDHLEIFSNGRYKSVLHRVHVNSTKSRISVASLHTVPLKCMIQPSPELVNESNPRQYKDTDFASFLEYISSTESKGKSFLESRKLS